jgi:hypothetical protein
LTMNKLLSLMFITGMFGCLFYDKYGTPDVKPVLARPLTVDQAKESFKQELLEKRYARAAVIARDIYRYNGCGDNYSLLTGKFAVEMGISPRILAALIFVESSCKPDAESSTKDIGLMQVHYPLYKRYSKRQLLDPAVNLAVGCGILKGYIKRYGVEEGLHAYNGFGDHTNTYSTKVLTAARYQ